MDMGVLFVWKDGISTGGRAFFHLGSPGEPKNFVGLGEVWNGGFF